MVPLSSGWSGAHRTITHITMKKKNVFEGTRPAIEEFLKENYPNFNHLQIPLFSDGANRVYWKCHGEQKTRWVGLKHISGSTFGQRGVDAIFQIDLDKADKAERESSAEKAELDDYFRWHREKVARLSKAQPVVDLAKEKVRELNQELNVQGNHTLDITANVQVTEDAKRNVTYHVDYIISHKSLITCNVSHFQEALSEFLADYAKWGFQKPR